MSKKVRNRLRNKGETKKLDDVVNRFTLLQSDDINAIEVEESVYYALQIRKLKLGIGKLGLECEGIHMSFAAFTTTTVLVSLLLLLSTCVGPP